MCKNKYYVFEINVVILNVFCLLLFVIMFGITMAINPELLIFSINSINIVWFILLYMLYMGLHEIFHSIAYVLYGGDLKKIVYGIKLESGVFYCLCKQDITRKNILNSLMFPLFYLGIITYIISFIFKLPYLLMLSIFNISGCIGDIIMFIYFIRLDKNICFTEFDNPLRFAIKSNKDISMISHFGLKYIENTDGLERNDLKKIKISKFSYVLLMLIFIWCFIYGKLTSL